MPGWEGVSFYEVFHYFRKHVKWPNLLERSAAIAYNFIMALPPSLLFLLTIIPHLPLINKKSLKLQLHALIYDIIPAKIHNAGIIKLIDDFLESPRVGLLSFGLLAALFFASNAMMGIIRSFNRDYLGFKKKNNILYRFTAIRLTLVIFGLVQAYFVILVLQGNILRMLVKDKSWIKVIAYSRWIFIVVLMFFAISFIFRYAPSLKKKWPFFNLGSVVATLLCLIASSLFTLYVMNFDRYNALYGAIGTFMMVMALIYINSMALLIGFELNVSLTSVSTLEALRLEKYQKALEAAKENAEKASVQS